jgi:hypothetical protein
MASRLARVLRNLGLDGSQNSSQLRAQELQLREERIKLQKKEKEERIAQQNKEKEERAAKKAEIPEGREQKRKASQPPEGAPARRPRKGGELEDLKEASIVTFAAAMGCDILQRC